MHESPLLTFQEFCQYLKIGETKARKMINDKDCRFVVRLDRRVFIHKELLDEYLKKNAKFRLTR